jgi:hypothetical protein
MQTHEDIAGELYEVYCKAVGGLAYDGKLLPAWKEFRADPGKRKQSDAWIEVAVAVEKMAGW